MPRTRQLRPRPHDDPRSLPHPSYDLDHLTESMAHEHAMRLWQSIPRWRRWLVPRPKSHPARAARDNAAVAGGPAPGASAGSVGGPHHRAADAWSIDESAFPRRGGAQAQLRFCLRYAILAPSSHNSQPWRFELGLRHVDLLADRTRGLPVTDPKDRELTISCGAALHHLELAMRCYGLGARTAVCAYAGYEGDHLARVRIDREQGQAFPEDARLLRQVTQRRTIRTAYETTPLPVGLGGELVAAARAHGADLTLVELPRDRAELASFVAEADLVQMHDARFRRELASWMHHNRSRSRDGMPGYAFAMDELHSLAAPLAIRTFDLGDGRAAADRELAEHCGALAILWTTGDAAADWLATGRALSDVLLRVTAAGVGASYLNQPVEVERLRARPADHFAIAGHPQLVLRLGYATRPPPPPTPRRPLAEVVASSDDDDEEEADNTPGHLPPD